ncbi:MAG: hypothetical protein WC942_04065 [Clostridia bacterium]|jgi:hypothetical protein
MKLKRLLPRDLAIQIAEKIKHHMSINSCIDSCSLDTKELWAQAGDVDSFTHRRVKQCLYEIFQIDITYAVPDLSQ